MAKIFSLLLVLVFLSGCAGMRLKEGGLDVGKDTTVGIEDLGVASVKKGF
jgi:hypothetical protein